MKTLSLRRTSEEKRTSEKQPKVNYSGVNKL